MSRKKQTERIKKEERLDFLLDHGLEVLRTRRQESQTKIPVLSDEWEDSIMQDIFAVEREASENIIFIDFCFPRLIAACLLIIFVSGFSAKLLVEKSIALSDTLSYSYVFASEYSSPVSSLTFPIEGA